MLRLAAVFLALISMPALAQTSLTGTIAVVGTGRVSVAPDRALVRLGVVTRARTAPDALRQHEADVARVLTRVRGFRVPDRDIQIEALSLSENYGNNGPDGYVAQRTVTVTLDSIRAVPDLVAAVVTEGANQLQGIQYVVRDTSPAEGRALDLAIADARAKAERVASASGVTLGRVLAVQEAGAASVPMPQMDFRGGRVAAVSLEASPGAYSAGSSEVRASVTVVFEIAR